MGAPKQFLELTPGVRLVDAALQAAAGVSNYVILVLPVDMTPEIRDADVIVAGGKSRSDSVAAGLRVLPAETEIVLVHDAAHPLAPRRLFLDVIDNVASGADAAVPVQPLSEVVKQRGTDGMLTTVGRDGLVMAQVPMAFAVDALLDAHAGRLADDLTWEDSMLVEQAGGPVFATVGSSWNIHVVGPEDLRVARALAAARDDLDNWDNNRSG